MINSEHFEHLYTSLHEHNDFLFRDWAILQGVYYTYLSLLVLEGKNLNAEQSQDYKLFIERDIYYSNLTELFNQNSNGVLMYLKGESMSSYYPKGVKRYSHDIDVICDDLIDLMHCYSVLVKFGFTELFTWIRSKTKLDYAFSVKLNRQNEHGDTMYFDQACEVHYQNFPISEFTYINPKVEREYLNEHEYEFLMLLANLTNRDGIYKKLSIKDMLDVHFLGKNLLISDQLVSRIKANFIYMSIFLIIRQWNRELNLSIPSVLTDLVVVFSDKKSDHDDLYQLHTIPFIINNTDFEPSIVQYRLELDKLISNDAKYYQTKYALELLEKGIPVAGKLINISGHNVQDCFYLSPLKRYPARNR
ncbi:hypothetical protein ACPFUZ_003324 [Vibrio cholerae]